MVTLEQPGNAKFWLSALIVLWTPVQAFHIWHWSGKSPRRDKCFFFDNFYSDWEHASLHCKSLPGGAPVDLDVADVDAEVDFIVKFMEDNELSPLWLAYRYNVATGKYEDPDGNSMPVTSKWGDSAGSQMSSSSSESCVVVDAETSLTSVDCSENIYAFCLVESASHCPAAATNSTGETKRVFAVSDTFSCDEGYVPAGEAPVCQCHGNWTSQPPVCTSGDGNAHAASPGGRCYRSSELIYDFNEAKSFCKEIGGSLANLPPYNTDEEVDYMQSIALEQNGYLWVGYHYNGTGERSNSDNFVDGNGIRLPSTTRWDQNAYSDLSVNSCVQLAAFGETPLFEFDCNSVDAVALCKLPPGACGITVTAEPPVPVTTVPNIGAGNATMPPPEPLVCFGPSPAGRTYHISDEEHDWDNAVGYCRNRSGFLTDLPSDLADQEVNYLRDIGYMLDFLWIGYRHIGAGDRADASSFQHLNEAGGVLPDTSKWDGQLWLDSEDVCIVLDEADDLLYEDDCYDTSFAVCNVPEGRCNITHETNSSAFADTSRKHRPSRNRSCAWLGKGRTNVECWSVIGGFAGLAALLLGLVCLMKRAWKSRQKRPE